MSAEDQRRVSAEMMARIDEVVSGHELQRSAEAAPQYVGRVEDRPLRFDEEPLTSLQHVEPRTWRVVDGVTSPPYGRCPCGAHLEYHGSFLACPECQSTFQLREDGWHGPPWTITDDGRFFGRITDATDERDAYEARARSLHADMIEAFPDRFHDDDADGTEATAAFFEGVDRARSRLGYPPDEGEVVEFEATGPLTVTLPLGLPPGVTITAVMHDTGSYEPFSAHPAPETRTAWREAYEGTLRGRLDRLREEVETVWTDLRLALLAHFDRDDR